MAKLLRYLALSVVFIASVSLTGYFSYTQADAGEDIDITANTTWSAGTYTYQDITISNNSTLTLEADTGTNTGVTINARNITIESGSKMSANGQGYDHDAGPSPGTVHLGYGGGGAYGGDGGDAKYTSGLDGRGGTAYGEVFNPTQLGSGGGDSFGGSGGGAITINASGIVDVDGTLSARGSHSSNTRDGGGAGGTINLTATSLTGSGDVTVKGGSCIGSDGGGGAGGRVLIHYTSTLSLPLANISADNGSGQNNGVKGSVFIQNTDSGDAQIAQDLILPADEGVDADGSTRTDGQLNLNDLTISNNATVTLESEYTDDTDGSGIDFNLTGDFDLESGSTIDTSEQGYGPLEGTGKGASDGVIGSGAGHGGSALLVGSATGGIEYDSAINPSDLGSGGGAPSDAGGTGGGIVDIACDGSANISGTVNAYGGDGEIISGKRGGGGSGGTVRINASTISDTSATGVINVDGGDGESGGYGGGGAGGRVAFFYNTMTFDSNDISVDGGREISGPYADDGTVFLFNITDNDVTVSNTMTFLATEGLDTDGSIRSDGVYYFNDLTITDSSTLTLDGTYSNDTDGNGITLYLTGDLDVDAGSTISANGQGYASEEGQGPGQGSGGLQSGSGASHGGLGGESAQSIEPTQTYGSAACPYLLGSGGGEGWNANPGGDGGGAIAITAVGDAFIDGDITANGEDGDLGTATYGSGGGSGGSIYLKADNVSGAGNLTAEGGAGGADADGAGGGGGGRISLIFITANTFPAGNISAAGGTGSVSPDRDGADGTKNTAQRTVPSSSFDLENPNNSSTTYTNVLENDLAVTDATATNWRPSTSAVVGPVFYDSNWVSTPATHSVTAGEGAKTIFAWFKNDNCVVSADYGQTSITLDQTDPTLTLLSASQINTTESSALVRARATDGSSGIDQAKINGVARPVGGSGIFQATVSLSVGNNTISLEAVDGAANTSTGSVLGIRKSVNNTGDNSGSGGGSTIGDIVFADTGLPYQEEEDQLIDNEKIEEQYGDDFELGDDGSLYYYVDNPVVYGTGEPNAKVKIWLNNVLLTTWTDENGDWSYQFEDLDEGDYTLLIKNVDENGKTLAEQDTELHVMGALIETGAESGQEPELEISDPPLTNWWLILLILMIIAGLVYYYFRKQSQDD